jgi:hypothetical protein
LPAAFESSQYFFDTVMLMTTFLRLICPVLTGLLLLGAAGANAQAPAWQSALVLGQAAGDDSRLTLTQADGTGNLFIAGTFSGSVTVGGTRLTSAGSQDIFVAKWSRATGGFVWAVRAGGSGAEVLQAMAANSGSLYLTGMFNGPTCAVGGTMLANAGTGSQDIFVAKLTDAGSSAGFTWAQRAGGTFNDSSNGIGVTAAGVFIAGSYSGPAAAFGTITLTAGGGYVAKLTESGGTAGFAWAQQAGSLINAIAVSGTNVYLVGNFGGAAVTFGAITLTNAGGNDIFVAKLTDAGASGAFVWAVRAGGPGTEAGLGAAAAGASVYVTGYFTSPTCTFGSSTLTNVGGQDAYVAKLTDAGASGAFVWGQRLGGTGNDYALSLTVQGSNVYVPGSFSSPTVDAGSTTLANAGAGFDVFLAHLTDVGPSGTFTWAQRAGGTGNDYASAVSISGTEVYFAGEVAPPASFGAIALASPSAGVGFLASVTDATALATASSAAKPAWSLSPNPATASVRLVSAVKGTLTLRDVLGRVARVYAVPAAPAGAVLDVADLPKGVYVGQLAVGGNSYTRRLVLE